MKNKTLATLLALFAAGSLALTLGGCGTKSATTDQNATNEAETSESETTESESETHDHGDAGAGFEEIAIGEDVEVGPLNVAAVYFQPVDMYPAGMGLSAAEANLHLEADISALANNQLGYAAGTFVPGLTVKYKIEDKNDASNVQEGTFMTMNASDGPHYGGNIKLDKDGEYTLSVIIASPESNGWFLHVDPETGVDGRFWTEPLVATFDWDYTVHQW